MSIKLEVMEERVANMLKQNGIEHQEIKDAIQAINDKLDAAFVTKTEFEPYKRAIIFVVTAVALSVVGYAIKVIASHGAM